MVSVSCSCSCLPSFFHLFSCTVCFTDLDQGSEIISKFTLPKSMKHTVVGVIIIKYSNSALNISCEVNTYRGVNSSTNRNINQRVSNQFQVIFFSDTSHFSSSLRIQKYEFVQQVKGRKIPLPSPGKKF